MSKLVGESSAKPGLGDDGASGVHTWIVPDNLVFADRLAAGLFGFSLAEGKEGRPLADYVGRIHSEDIEHVSHSIAVSMTSGRPYHEEYRVCRPDGTTVEVAAFGAWFHDASGEPTHYAGIMMLRVGEQTSEISLLQQLLLSYDLAKHEGRNRAAAKVLDAIAEIGWPEEDVLLLRKTAPH